MGYKAKSLSCEHMGMLECWASKELHCFARQHRSFKCVQMGMCSQALVVLEFTHMLGLAMGKAQLNSKCPWKRVNGDPTDHLQRKDCCFFNENGFYILFYTVSQNLFALLLPLYYSSTYQKNPTVNFAITLKNGERKKKTCRWWLWFDFGLI